MALRRVFVDLIEGSEAVARGSSAHHLARVARLQPGERVEVSDQVTAYLAVTETCGPREVRFRVGEQLPKPARGPQLNAALAIIKFPRFEWAIEKLTELGVDSITPVIAARSDAKLVLSAVKRAGRWRRIALDAAQQSRRLAAPVIAGPVSFEETVRDCPAGTKLFTEPRGKPVGDLCGWGHTTALVGPEGGWTAEEAALAEEHGFEAAGLGQTILRSETAAVAIAAICSCGSERESKA